MPELTPGTEFAGHRIEGVAGRGGMGVVYRATHLALDHVVALKLISPELASDERFRERFVRESRAAVSIRHPNVVAVRHAGEEDGLLFVTMDLIDGVDLGRLLQREGALEPRRAAAIIAQVASALDAAHERGLIHRDVKPGNVLIEERADGEHAYLTDFGLTKRIDASANVTATGAFVGTIDYVAPEQIRGEQLDARTDVYALGCVLFDAVAGLAPFADRGEQVAKLYAHLQDPPPRLSEAAPPGTPTALDAVVDRAMAKDPDRRFPSAGAMGAAAMAAVASPAATVESTGPAPAVEEVEAQQASEQASPPAAEAPPATGRPRRSPRRRLALLGGVAALIVAGIVVGLVASGSGGGGSPAAGGSASAPPRSKLFGAPTRVPGSPTGMGVGEGGVWSALRDRGKVARIDPRTGKVSATVAVGAQPSALAAKLGKVWVANAGDGTVSPVDVGALKAGKAIRVGADPVAIGFAAQSLWVANSGSGTVSRIAADGSVGRPIRVGAGPQGVAAGPGGVWISNGGDDSISVIDPATEKAGKAIKLPAGSNPMGSAIAAGRFWVADEGSGTVTAIDLATRKIVRTIKVAPEPRDVAVGGNDLYVSCGGGEVARLTPASSSPTSAVRVRELSLGPGSSPQSASSGFGKVWVADGAGDEVVPLELRPAG